MQASLVNENYHHLYNIRNVYQTKDIQPWSESLKNVQVCVIEKSFNCTLAHNSCKSIAENFDRHVTVVVLKLFSTRTLSAFPLLWLPSHHFELDMWR